MHIMGNMDDFYGDEPIVFGADDGNASHWDFVEDTAQRRDLSWAGHARSDDVPQDINMLLVMIDGDRWSLTNSKSFYEQALFMAGYKDDVPIVPFFAFYPTYKQMSVAQLRSYFTIRKLLRQGKFPDVSLSYIFVYAYETLMQIGVATPEEGYEILCELRDNYPGLNQEQRPYLTEWLKDYVVWYGLTNHYADSFAKERQEDDDVDLMNSYAKFSDEALFGILDRYTHHGISKGALYKKQPVAAVSAVAFVMRRLIGLIEKHYGHRMGILCYGTRVRRQHVMFEMAVFYSPDPVMEMEVNISSAHCYTCCRGLWKKTVTAERGTITPPMLKAVLHDVDALVRQRLGVKPAIKALAVRASAYLDQPMLDAVAEWYGEWKARENERKEIARRKALRQARQSVSIDLGKLGKIREDADVVRDKLIVEEIFPTTDPTSSPAPSGRGENLPQSPQKGGEICPSPIEDVASPRPDGSGLGVGAAGDEASTFLSLLLFGGDYKAFLRQAHIPAGVMVEKINEKAMEEIGDVVLEDDGEKITVIEDYRNDIKHLYE